ncbi:TolC family protein [Steroidobacter flavus]|uniref:TolC family protein n=1 Tax=Steroidobacter flavus TaxID=1842136 RepID=A0ABV8SYI6_9GAMM
MFVRSLGALIAAALVLTPATAVYSDPLSLEQSIELALQRAPELQARAAMVEAAQHVAVAAGRLPDPELLLGTANPPVDGRNAWSFDRDEMTMREIGVMQTFPNSRKRASEREQAEAQIKTARAKSLQEQQEVAVQVSRAWFEVYAAHAAVLSLEQSRPEITLQAEAARSALASGRGTAADALAAASAVGEFEDRLLEARRMEKVARIELARWLGDDASRELAAPGPIDQLPAPREALLASIHQHVALETLDAELSAADARLNLARAQKRPDITTELSYGKRGDVYGDMVSFQVRIGLPIFGGTRQDPVIAARHAELEQLRSDREAQLRMHTAEVAQQLEVWESARARIQLLERDRLPIARERSRATLVGFQSGQTMIADVLDAQLDEFVLEREHAKVLADLGAAWAYLAYLNYPARTVAGSLQP